MSRDAILYDLTEFLKHPLRTGIQRVVHETAAHWPVAGQLRPVRVADDGVLRLLPETVFAEMADFFGATAGDAVLAKARLLAASQHPGQPLTTAEVRRYRAVLNVELFFDSRRAGFYRGLAAAGGRGRVFFFVHDLLPWLHPEWFARGGVVNTMEYLRLIRSLEHLS